MGDVSSPDLVLDYFEANLSPGTRWAIEQQKLRTFFPSFQLVGNGSTVTAAIGTIETHTNNSYSMRIQLDSFPFALPKVFARDWEIHPYAPHKFGRDRICIMRENQWRQNFTIALVVAKTAIWLGKYEVWKRNGNVWPGLGQAH